MRRRPSRSRSPSPTRSRYSKLGLSFATSPYRTATMAKIAVVGACVLLATFLLVQYVSSSPPKTKLRAVAILKGNSDVKGTIKFEQDIAPQSNQLQQNSNPLHVSGEITGLKPAGEHGFHVHEFGDLTDGCTSAGEHWNPRKHEHGAPEDNIRHDGDLGNVIADATGKVTVDVTDPVLTLAGLESIIGRAIVVHEKADDLGKAGTAESKKTGSAGGRPACGIIGWQKE